MKALRSFKTSGTTLPISEMSGHELDNHSLILCRGTNFFLITAVSKVVPELTQCLAQLVPSSWEKQLKNQPSHSCILCGE
jgi:hypothetical protein